jgi:hypothetical protein
VFGLTVTQPWALAFALGKALENRAWEPPAALGRFTLALHGGVAPKGERHDEALMDLEAILQREPRLAQELALLEKALALRKKYGLEYVLDRASRFGIFAVAEFVGVYHEPEECPEEQRQWYVGPCAWRLEKVFMLPKPVPCRGYPKLWRVPSDVLIQVQGFGQR